MGNTLISLIKDTSLVSVITVTELLRSAQEVIATTFQPLPLYLAAAALHWVLSSLLAVVQNRLEGRLALRTRIFDEPTCALDPEMINEVLDVMIELAQEGMTMVCVTHEMGFARKVADRVLFMDAGVIVEDCVKDSFFDTPRSERARDFLAKVLH